MATCMYLIHTRVCMYRPIYSYGCFIFIRVWNRPVGSLCFILLFHRYETDHLHCGSIGMEQKPTVGRLWVRLFSKHPSKALESPHEPNFLPQLRVECELADQDRDTANMEQPIRQVLIRWFICLYVGWFIVVVKINKTIKMSQVIREPSEQNLP